MVAIYSTFLQRAYDQLIHDVQIQNLPVVFAIDRAGLVGADGATHNGSFDLSYLRCLPEHDGDDAFRRERVPADALHGVPDEYARPRCAIRAAPGPGVPIQKEMQRAADRQRRDPPRRRPRSRAQESRSWRSAPWCSRR